MSSVIRMSRAETTAAPGRTAPGRSSLSEAARMFRRSGSAMLGLALVVLLGAAAALAPLLAPHDPDVIDTAHRLARPLTPGHPLGTAAGSVCGLLAGFVGRWVDQLVMRSIDTLMAFPYFLLAVAIIATLGPGLVNGMGAVA